MISIKNILNRDENNSNKIRVPPLYKDYILKTQIYHCTQSELEKQDANVVDADFSIWSLIQEAEDKKIKRQKQKQNTKWRF